MLQRLRTWLGVDRPLGDPVLHLSALWTLDYRVDIARVAEAMDSRIVAGSIVYRSFGHDALSREQHWVMPSPIAEEPLRILVGLNYEDRNTTVVELSALSVDNAQPLYKVFAAFEPWLRGFQQEPPPA